MSGSEAEVTSVELHSDGDTLLAATKSNSNDLFDLRNTVVNPLLSVVNPLLSVVNPLLSDAMTFGVWHYLA